MSKDSVEVTYTAGDLAAATLASWRWWLGMMVAVALVIVVLPVFIGMVQGYDAAELIRATDPAFVALILLIVLFWIVVVSIVSFWWNKRKNQAGPILFSLTEEALAFRSRDMEGSVFWHAIKSVRRGRTRLFLFLSKRRVFIIPRRAFESDADFASFGERAEAHWAKSR